jgi:hypothetical protein
VVANAVQRRRNAWGDIEAMPRQRCGSR